MQIPSGSSPSESMVKDLSDAESVPGEESVPCLSTSTTQTDNVFEPRPIPLRRTRKHASRPRTIREADSEESNPER